MRVISSTVRCLGESISCPIQIKMNKRSFSTQFLELTAQGDFFLLPDARKSKCVSSYQRCLLSILLKIQALKRCGEYAQMTVYDLIQLAEGRKFLSLSLCTSQIIIERRIFHQDFFLPHRFHSWWPLECITQFHLLCFMMKK